MERAVCRAASLSDWAPMAETRTLRTETTGRYLVERGPAGAPLLVGFHGYGQNAEMLLDDLRHIPGAEAWTLVSIQALHRFYDRKTGEVVASWMTSQDREAAISPSLKAFMSPDSGGTGSLRK